MASKSPYPPAGSVTAAHAASEHPPPAKDSFLRLIDGTQALFRQHFALARLELRDDVRQIVKDAALSAAGVPLLLVGYTILMIALALALATAMASWVAFGIVALVNLAAGAVLGVVYGKRIGKQDKIQLSGTTDELQRNREWMGALREGTRPQPVPVGPEAQELTPSPAEGRPAPLPGASMPPADGRVSASGTRRYEGNGGRHPSHH
jgi:hypothetical protein